MHLSFEEVAFTFVSGDKVSHVNELGKHQWHSHHQAQC